MSDKFNTILFILSILSKFYPGQILSAVRLKICPLVTKFVRSRQTIRTCEAFAMPMNPQEEEVTNPLLNQQLLNPFGNESL